MSNRRNIESWKSKAIWTVILVSMAVLMILSIQRKKNLQIEALAVYVNPIEGSRNMISKEDVKMILLNQLGYDMRQLKIEQLDLAKIEATLQKDTRVKTAEVYLNADNQLNVILEQRHPVVRVSNEKGKDYYLDNEGKRVRVKKGSTVRVPVATGNINAYTKGFNGEKESSALKNLYAMCLKINEDKFLKALVEQIHVNNEKSMYIIPKVGRQRISIDPSEGVDDKLANLKIFYKDGLPRTGWSEFSELKIDYKKQVVGVRSQD